MDPTEPVELKKIIYKLFRKITLSAHEEQLTERIVEQEDYACT